MLGSAFSSLRTLIVLVVFGVVLLIAAIWGWKQMTKPFPAKADAAACVSTRVSKGDKIYPAQVVVSVMNASSREGLARRTMQALTDEGFVSGSSGNASKKVAVKRAQVWAADPQSPSARLVASWLHNPKLVKKTSSLPGVVVVVGEKFPQVSGGKKVAVAKATTTICSPPAD